MVCKKEVSLNGCNVTIYTKQVGKRDINVYLSTQPLLNMLRVERACVKDKYTVISLDEWEKAREKLLNSLENEC